jgi:hypothetical protein
MYINFPTYLYFYMARNVMILKRANSLLGPLVSKSLRPRHIKNRYINRDRYFGNKNCIAFILSQDRDPVPPTQMIGSSAFVFFLIHIAALAYEKEVKPRYIKLAVCSATIKKALTSLPFS